MAALISEARNAFRSSGGKHSVEMDLEPDLPWVMVDRARIAQMLDNLLSNAARNSPESSPIRVSAAREETHVAVSVSDEGRGIPGENLPNLFRKFSRIDSGEQGGWHRLGTGYLQGYSRSPRGPHLGRERWTRTGGAVHLHYTHR